MVFRKRDFHGFQCISFVFTAKMLLGIILAHDGGLGRFDRACIPQQALMELLVENVQRTRERRKKRAAEDACAWKGVDCDADANVVSIEFSDSFKGGSVDVQYIPQSVKKFVAFGNNFKGSLDLRTLPKSLEVFDMSLNELSGELVLDVPQHRLQEIDLSQNNFHGSLRFDALPDTLIELRLSENLLSGSIDLASLPVSIEGLSLEGNALSGEVGFDALPASIRWIDLSGNMFTGSVRVTKAPKMLENLLLENNRFAGTATIDLTEELNVTLGGTKIRRAVDSLGQNVISDQIEW